MKQTILYLASCLLLFASCSSYENILSFKLVHENFSPDVPGAAWTYANPDGYVIKDSLGHAPLNSKTTFYDNQGKPIAYVGCASEAYPIVLKVFYDKKNRVNMIVKDNTTDFDAEYKKLSKNKKFSEFFANFDTAVALKVFEGKPYSQGDDIYLFEYNDEDGHLERIYDPYNHYSISAGEDAELSWSIKEDEAFWHSDMTGGQHFVEVKTAHTNPDNKVFNITYRDYKIHSVEAR